MPRMSFTEISRPQPGVAVITLNRPERMNAMAFDVMIPFRDALREIGSDNGVRVVVITGAGRGFCSGADHENPGTMPNMDGLTLPTIALRSMELLDDVISTIRRLHQPVIAAVNGAAIGGGFCLALAADIRIAATGLLPGCRHQQRPHGGRARIELPPAAVDRAVTGGRDHAHGT
jgi:enoyl-CoA hydratase